MPGEEEQHIISDNNKRHQESLVKLESIALVTKIIALLTIGPIVVIGNLGIKVTGGFWACPFPLPFIMCNVCPIFCTFGQIRSGLFLGIVGTNFLAGQAFCGFFCPGGIIQDLLFKVPLRKITIPRRADSVLRHIRYGVAILVIGLVIHATNLWVGFPLMAELWFFLARYGDEVRMALIGTAIILLGLALFVGRSWCRYLCPFGAWISVFNKYSLLKRRRSPGTCVSCRLCHQRCSGGLNPMGSQGTWRSLECVRCLQCYTACQANVFQLHWRGWRKEEEIMKRDTKRWKSVLRRALEVVILMSFIVIGGMIVWQGIP
ncbi:hypothetical protein HKBW3S09_00833 [Candidatus Hakubella thermalkaliphila]|uniref:4Fe-4S ferredoxin-type domain-containing protein n=1 Tax=Candidatus Hakubella thermalkaliphila TaxID=2754717 RepID=A0A6V8NXV0_9ACTN|nr:hypothetical protein HKBW3S09_00833 [Candidatus Hakubella thermalkaliphila]